MLMFDCRHIIYSAILSVSTDRKAVMQTFSALFVIAASVLVVLSAPLMERTPAPQVETEGFGTVN